MKIRQSFVANSSSSSFVLIQAGNETIFEAGYQDLECCTCDEVNIDELIQKLQNAKAKGVTKVRIESGGGYDG